MDLTREPLQEGEQVGSLLGPDSVVVDSQQDTVGVDLGVQAEEKLAELKSCPVAPFPAQNVNVLEETLSEHAIKWLLVLRVEVKSRHWSKLLRKCLTIARRIDRRYELELIHEGAFEGEKTSLQNSRCL